MKKIKDKKRIGILRGGTEGDYDSSLREGGEIILHIFENLSERWKVVDIFIDKSGVWHMGGVAISPSILPQKVDLVWNVAHHSMANILQSFSIPTINISSFSFLLKQDNDILREHIKELDLNMPKKIVLPLYQADFDARPTGRSFGRGPIEEYTTRKAREVLGKFPAPWIVRTFTPDSDMGIHLAKTFPELMSAIKDGVQHKKSILVEEFISGKNVSIHSVSGFRGEDVYVFPICTDRSHYNLPNGKASFSTEEKDQFMQTARNLHKHLGAEHYLQSNFVLHPKRGIFVTDISFSQDLKKDSHLSQSCELVGAKMHHIVEHILEKAL